MSQAPSEGPGDAGNLLTQKQYADRKGWSKQYVHQLVRQGKIPVRDGKIDPAEADAALSGGKDPARDKGLRSSLRAETAASALESSTSLSTPTFVKARTVRENYRAMREKLEYDLLLKTLVYKADVAEAAYSVGVLVRERYTKAAFDIGQALAAKFRLDGNEVCALLDAELRRVLKEICIELSTDRWGFQKGMKLEGVPGAEE